MSARPKSEYAPALMAENNSVLDDFTKSTFTHDGKTRDVYRQGTGPVSS